MGFLTRNRAPDDVVVMPVNVTRQRRVYRLLAVLLLLLLLIAAWGGWFVTDRSMRLGGAERAGLEAHILALEAKLRAAREDVAMYQTGNEVAFQAQEHVRQELRALRDQQAELQEAVTFYKSIMSPGEETQGLRVERLDMTSTPFPDIFGYRLVLSQPGDNSKFVTGDISFLVHGTDSQGQSGQRAAMVVEEDSDNAFRFRYFQELTGRIRLPAGFLPREIIVEVQAGGRETDKVTRQFNWQIQER